VPPNSPADGFPKAPLPAAALGGGELLIPNRTHARGETVEPDEPGRIALLVHVVFAESDEPLVVERVRALAADHLDAALVEPEGDRAGDALLCDGHEGVVRFALRRPPPALVYEVGVSGRDEVLGSERLAIQHKLLELGVRSIEQGAAGQLTTTSGPDCSNGAVSGFGTGSPASTMFSGLASTFVQAADGAPGRSWKRWARRRSAGPDPPRITGLMKIMSKLS